VEVVEVTNKYKCWWCREVVVEEVRFSCKFWCWWFWKHSKYISSQGNNGGAGSKFLHLIMVQEVVEVLVLLVAFCWN
jgi:hypothetical protein